MCTASASESLDSSCLDGVVRAPRVSRFAVRCGLWVRVLAPEDVCDDLRRMITGRRLVFFPFTKTVLGFGTGRSNSPIRGCDCGTGVGGLDGLRVMLWPSRPVRSNRVVLCVSPEGALDFFKMGCRGALLALLPGVPCSFSSLPLPAGDALSWMAELESLSIPWED